MHEPWLPSFCKQQSRTRHSSSCSWRSTNWGKAKRREEEVGSQFWFLISYFHGFWLLSSGSEPTWQMEAFTPPSCLVYTRRDAQKPRQKTFLAERAELSDILLTRYHCSCDLGLQKNPATRFVFFTLHQLIKYYPGTHISRPHFYYTSWLLLSLWLLLHKVTATHVTAQAAVLNIPVCSYLARFCFSLLGLSVADCK